MGKVEVRKPFASLSNNAYVWAILLDVTDIFLNAIDLILTPFFGVGIVTNTIGDAFQTVAGLLVFEDWRIGIFNEDWILPQGLDVFPSFTFNVFVLERMGG